MMSDDANSVGPTTESQSFKTCLLSELQWTSMTTFWQSDCWTFRSLLTPNSLALFFV